MEAYFVNDGSIFSRVYARQLAGQGYQLHSGYGRYALDDDAEQQANAQEIADTYCASHDVLTIEMSDNTKGVCESTLFDKAIIHLIACSAAIREYLIPKIEAGINVQHEKKLFFGIQLSDDELGELLSPTMAKSGWVFERMPIMTEEEALALGGES